MEKPSHTRHTGPNWLWGLVLIILGAVFLLNQTVLRMGEIVWMTIMAGISLSFLAVYLSNRRQRWALIPAYVFGAIGGLLLLAGVGFRNDWIALYVLAAIAAPFYAVYLRNREQWWALIPAYVMTVIAGLVVLDGVFGGEMVASTIMFAIAGPFVFVFLRNPKNWWALIPAGIMGLIGLGLLASAFAYLVPAALIVLGVYLMVRYLAGRPAGGTPPAPAAPPEGVVEFEPIGRHRPDPERPEGPQRREGDRNP